MSAQRQHTPAVSRNIWLFPWVIIFALILGWQAQNLDAFSLSNDEGAHVMWARLAIDGYPLYSQTRAVQAPLFLETVGLAFRLAGPTLQAGRWVILISFGLLAAGLSWLAYRTGGWPAALAALVLAGISPLIFTFSRWVMAEVPATALVVVSLALLFQYGDCRGKGWLVASGVALGLSFITKALYPFLVAPVGLLLWLYQRQSDRESWPSQGWAWLQDCLWWGGGVLIPLAATLLVYDPAALYDQLVRFRGDLRAAVTDTPADTWAYFTAFISSHWGFWLLALGGIISTVFRLYLEKRVTLAEQQSGNRSLFPWSTLVLYPIIWVVWLVAGLAMLWWHMPLFPHHFIILLPPLILLGTNLVAGLVVLRPGTWGHAGWQIPAGRLILGLILGGALFNGPALVRANQQTAAIVTGGREAEALDLLRAVSNPDDFVMGDSQLLIFMADRRTPPALGDVALVAIKAGQQTSARMIALTKQSESPAVVQWSLRLPWLPEYLDWVKAHYLVQRTWDNDHIIYFGRRWPAGTDQIIPNERSVGLGDSLVLRGYEIDSEPVRPGAVLSLKVYWQTRDVLAEDYTVFTQLLDRQGALVASWDSQPLGGYLPTSHWPAGEIVTDMIHLPLPAELPTGNYTLITGMYLLDTLERLPATGSKNDYITLATVSIN